MPMACARNIVHDVVADYRGGYGGHAEHLDAARSTPRASRDRG
jgi:hypothetical protein